MKTVDRVLSAFLRRIVRRMQQLGITQTALAQRMNVSRPYVVKILHGDVNISFGTAIKFAKAVGMDFVPTLRPREGEANAGKPVADCFAAFGCACRQGELNE